MQEKVWKSPTLFCWYCELNTMCVLTFHTLTNSIIFRILDWPWLTLTDPDPGEIWVPNWTPKTRPTKVISSIMLMGSPPSNLVHGFMLIQDCTPSVFTVVPFLVCIGDICDSNDSSLLHLFVLQFVLSGNFFLYFSWFTRGFSRKMLGSPDAQRTL